MKKKRLLAILLVVSLLLLIPLIAMQFTNEVHWSISDFIVAGVLLYSTAFMCEFITRKITKVAYRIVICSAILLLLALIWIELAVGLFGTPFAGS